MDAGIKVGFTISRLPEALLSKHSSFSLSKFLWDVGIPLPWYSGILKFSYVFVFQMKDCFGPQQTKIHFWKDFSYPYRLLVLTNVVLA